jgi:thioesterase domain-containing protein
VTAIVPIKPTGSKEAIFFTPGGDGAGGALLVYGTVARLLDADQPFFGLRARGVDDDAEPHASVEAMAADYLAEIRAVQPNGPYFFGGECIGGVVAYEMAQQARAAGDDVGLLVLFDSRPPRRTSLVRHRIRLACVGVRRASQRVLGPLPTDPVGVPLAPEGAEGARLRLHRWIDGRLPYPFWEAPVGFRPEWAAYQRKLLRHRPRPYAGTLTLLLSAEYAGKRVDRDWAALVDGVEVHLTPGDHHTYIREHAPETAAILAACLDRARART